MQIHIDTAHNKATINSVRAPFYRRVYSTLIKSLQANDALRGQPLPMLASLSFG